MIYTVTFNPALDYSMTAGEIALGKTNRATKESVVAGGKGINVSMLLGNLGMESVALGFIAGFTGKAIADMTSAMGVNASFIEVEGLSRINVKLKGDVETEINGVGPVISAEALSELFNRLDGLTAGDYLVLAGSVPSSLPKNVYEEILKRLEGRGVSYVVDATGELLKKVLPYKPFLIKPNTQELGEFFGVNVESKDDALFYAEKLQKEGARNVVVSMGGDGAVLITEKGEKFKLDAPKGKVVNTVGSGDSLVAGFIYGYVTSGDYYTAFKTGIAAGSASAFEEGLATKEQIEAVLERM